MLANRLSRLATFIFLPCLLVCLGCPSKAPPSSISGKIVRNGKPVYPVVLMLQDASGKSLTANVKNQDGSFSVVGVEVGSKYSVAIEPINLPGISAEAREKAAKQNEEAAKKAAAEGRELRREETLPAQFQNANIDFPKKYTSFSTSELSIDCTTAVPTESIELNLK